MARYRQKNQDDLVWNRIRRHLTREIDTAIQDAREEVLNTILTSAFQKYETGMNEGRIQELESKYADLIRHIVTDVVPQPAMIFKDA